MTHTAEITSDIANPVTSTGIGDITDSFKALYTSFDGTGDAILANNLTTVLSDTDSDTFTFSCMCKPMVLTDTAHNIVNSGYVKIRIKTYGGGIYYFSWRVQGATADCHAHGDTRILVNNVYHLHLTCDFSGAGTTVKAFVNGVEQTLTNDDTLVTGTFILSDLIVGFSGTGANPPANLYNGCLGPMWFKSGLYEDNPEKFANGDIPYDWSKYSSVTALGDPGLFIKDWLETSGLDIVNYGTTSNLGNTVNGNDPTYGDPTRC